MNGKRRSWWKTALTAVLVLVLAAGCSAGGGGGSGTSPSPEPGSGTNGGAGGETGGGAPAAENGGETGGKIADGVTLRVGTTDNHYAPKSLTTGLPVWNEIEEKTGVKIEWDVTPSSQYVETMKVRVTAGRDLPDILNDPFGDPVKMADMGIFIPLDDLIEEHAPNIKQFFEDYPDIASRMRAPDGKIYALSSVTSGAAKTDPYSLQINRRWLENLGLEEPRTLDEWYNVLKAFKEQDPNGNGVADEIPFSPQNGVRGLTIFGSALDLHMFYSMGYYPNEDGKIEYAWLTEEGEQLMRWLNKLYSEGLIDPEFANYNAEQYNSKIARDMVGLTNTFLANIRTFNLLQEQNGIENPGWGPALPPAPEGGKGFYEEYGPLSGWYGITSSSKHPEVAIKWLDYIYASEEGSRYMAFGIEGLSYEMVDGKPVFTDWTMNNPDGLSYTDALRTLGAMPTVPWIRATEGYLSDQPKAIMDRNPDLKEEAERLEEYLVPNAAFGLASVEESERLSTLMADINTYLDENLVKFVMGTQPIDWAKFTSDLKNLGIDEVVAIRQAQYDRYQEALKQ